MNNRPIHTLSLCCIDQGAVLTLSFDASEVIRELKNAIEKNLLLNGIAVQWVEEACSPAILIRVISIDQGNQFLRWMLPFIAPAMLEVEGQIAIVGLSQRSFHHIQKAQMGLAGGMAKDMLKRCAMRTADKILGEVLHVLKA